MTETKNKIILIIGGARSGKSDYAQQLAARMRGKVLFCATAEPLDEEMKTRIAAHKKSRPPEWGDLEAHRNVGASLEKSSGSYNTIIIDCVTVLVANCLGDVDSPEQSDLSVLEEISRLMKVLVQREANYILVTNDVGSGLVPDNRLGRIYRDALGRANQMLAGCADEAYLMVAGLPVKIK
jgi:adenosylcobinamide kinase/adenosylcobinamide-phosphate guanylyltransferase